MKNKKADNHKQKYRTMKRRMLKFFNAWGATYSLNFSDEQTLESVKAFAAEYPDLNLRDYARAYVLYCRIMLSMGWGLLVTYEGNQWGIRPILDLAGADPVYGAPPWYGLD